MSWQEVLDIKLGGAQFWASPLGRIWGEAWTATTRENRGRSFLDKTAGHRAAEYTQQLELDKFMHASPIWASAEMLDVVEAATPQFEPEPLLSTDMICPYGCMKLERPIYFIDRNDRPIDFNLVTWSPMVTRAEDSTSGIFSTSDGILLSLYADLNQQAVDASEEEMANIKAQGWRWPFVLTYMTPWRFGKSPIEMVETSDDTYADKTAFLALWRQIQVLFRMMHQTVTTVERRQGERGARRRAKREGMEDTSEITVITLRRASAPPDEAHVSEDANYSHRFIVGGHWRNQWYPSINAHRQIWISPYVKGPEDKPLRIDKNRAYEFKR